MKEQITELKDLDDLTLAKNLLLHHREADRYAKEKFKAKRDLFNSENAEEFFRYKKRFKQIEATQSATIQLRDAILIILQERKNLDASLIAEPLVLMAFNALIKREKNEAISSTKVSQVTKDARFIGVRRSRKVEVEDSEYPEVRKEASSISWLTITAGESREDARKPLKRFYSNYGMFMRMEMPS